MDPHPPKYSPDDKYVRYRIADRYAQVNIEHHTNNIQDDGDDVNNNNDDDDDDVL